jgi:sortase A
MMRKLAFICIVLGALTMSYPQLNESYQIHREQKLLSQFEKDFEASSLTDQLSPSQFESITNNITSNNETSINPIPIVRPLEQLDGKSSSLLKNGAMGILKIKKIDLVLPILEGATNANMKYAAAHISETTQFGKIGNAGIAAHRMRTKGLLFNRLNEVEVGDQIVIRKLNEEFTYTVFSVSLVKPDDVSVLGRNNRDSILTLITCDPIENATHRLIVKAKLD